MGKINDPDGWQHKEIDKNQQGKLQAQETEIYYCQASPADDGDDDVPERKIQKSWQNNSVSLVMIS